MPRRDDLSFGMQVDLDRLGDGTMLVANVSKKHRGGYFYFTVPDGQPFDGRSARYLIQHGYVEPAGDAMFDGHSQTYRVTPPHNEQP